MKRKTKTYTKKWKIGLNPISAGRPPEALKIPVFIGKTQPTGAYEDRGSKRSP